MRLMAPTGAASDLRETWFCCLKLIRWLRSLPPSDTVAVRAGQRHARPFLRTFHQQREWQRVPRLVKRRYHVVGEVRALHLLSWISPNGWIYLAALLIVLAWHLVRVLVRPLRLLIVFLTAAALLVTLAAFALIEHLITPCSARGITLRLSQTFRPARNTHGKTSLPADLWIFDLDPGFRWPRAIPNPATSSVSFATA
jgi:hypothetical protein